MEYLQATGKKGKRVGRGIGSGKGKTCGRGTKGQKARKSGHTRPGFEGGQTPIYRRLPKRGPKRSISDNKQLFSLINLVDLERNKNILDGQTLDFSQKKEPIKILGRGELTKKLIIRAAAFSQTAQTKILQLGGKIEVANKIWEPKRKE